ncbi:MAG TPA: hypothetical protein EYG79_12580 [Rhodobacteraceae bacterium]|nr:hypothetical protein [Paracoccaceae bacterium]
MASKSPAELKSEGVELKTVLAKVKKKQHNCAILMSKDGIVIEVHLIKSPEVLVKAAKKKGGMAKGAWGTLTMNGQVVVLDPINDKVPGNLPKVAKKFFSERGLKNRLEIKAPEEGAEATEEPEAAEEETARGRPEAAAPEPEAPAPASGDADEESPTERGGSASEEAPEGGGEEADPKAALEARLEEQQPRIDALLADTKSLMIDGIKNTMGLFTRAMDDELFDRADDALNRVIIVLDDYDGLMAQKQPFLDRMKSMFRNVEKLATGPDDEVATAISRYKREFDSAVENSEWYSSGEKLDQMEALVKEHQGAGGDDEPDEEESGNFGETAPSEAPATETSDSEAPSTPEQSGDERGRLVQAFKELTPRIKTALKSDNKVDIKKIATLAKGFAAAIRGGDLVKSQKIMDFLEPLVDQPAGNAPQEAASENESISGKPVGEDSGTENRKSGRLNKIKDMRSSIAGLMASLKSAR